MKTTTCSPGPLRIAALALAAALAGTACSAGAVKPGGGGGATSGGTDTGGTDTGGDTGGDTGSDTGSDVVSSWSLSDGANPADAVEQVTLDYTVTVNLTAGTFTYVDPLSLGDVSRSLPASGSTEVALDADPASASTLTFTKDAYGFTVAGAMAAGKLLKLALTGSYSGSVTVQTNRKLALSLAGASITSTNGPALNIQSGKRTFVVLEDGTASALVDASTAAWSPRTLADGTAMDLKGTLFSEGPLIFSGTGALTVTGVRAHAVASDAHVRIRGGTLTLSATGLNAADPKDGVHTRDAFVMDGGTVTVRSSFGDGVQVEGNEGTTPLGFLAINGGTLSVTAVGDGLKTSFDPSGTVETASTADDPDPFIVVNGGTIGVKVSGSSSDAIQSRSTLSIHGGTITATATGTGVSSSVGLAKGILATSDVHVHDGTLLVSTARAEAIKSTDGSVTIDGGTLELYAGEDGIAAQTAITINGGTIFVHSPAGDTDGLDSNGTMTLNGGLLVIEGPGDAPGDALDGNSPIVVNGGTFMTVGGTGAMEGVVLAPTVGVVKLTVSAATWSAWKGQSLVVTPAGSEAPVFGYQLPSAISCSRSLLVIFRHPGLVAGSRYDLHEGSGTLSGTSWHGFYSAAPTATGLPASPLTTFAATSGLVSLSF